VTSDAVRSRGRTWAPSALIATTGLRRAEALALRWDDVDLERAQLTIRQTVTVADGVIVWQRDAKSDDSERTTRSIAAPSPSSAATASGSSTSGSPPVPSGPPTSRTTTCSSPALTGPPSHPSGPPQQFTRRVDAARLPRIGVHGLRHTWATLALRAGVPFKVVSERIGHADPAVTMQVYAHALEGDDAAAEITATAIFGDR
jgi:integrase